jgi:hypothetical protein
MPGWPATDWRLAGKGAEKFWDSRGHFFAAAAQAMRRILIENARRRRRPKHGGDRVRRRPKHGGDRVRRPLDEVDLHAPVPREDLLKTAPASSSTHSKPLFQQQAP